MYKLSLEYLIILVSNETSQEFGDHVKKTEEPNRRGANWQNVGHSGLQYE